MDNSKQSAGFAAADLIQHGMLVGLGTGSTAAYFIERLIERHREGLNIQAVASSIRSQDLARKGGIPIVDISTIDRVDITVDGADEIDAKKRMIKGGGGALVREKILACMSGEMLVIVDETKLVKQLGKQKLPVEVIPFACHATERHINDLGYFGKWRKNHNETLYETDNHNYIFDIHFESLRTDPETDNRKILEVPGVVDTGFFFNIAGRVLVGYRDGTTKIID